MTVAEPTCGSVQSDLTDSAIEDDIAAHQLRHAGDLAVLRLVG